MPFPESVRLKACKKALFMCVACHSPFVEVHHIIPESEGGPDTLNNAAPLCSGCHSIYGASPIFRKQIKQMRDNWYDVCDRRFSALSSGLLEQVNQLSETLKSEKEDRHKYLTTFNEIKELLIENLSASGNAIREAQNLSEIQNIIIEVPKTNTPFGNIIFYPGLIVGVQLITGNYQNFEFILDSGADCTVVPKYMG